MNKLFTLAVVCALSVPSFANDIADTADIADDSSTPQVETVSRKQVAAWPAFFALCEFPATPDLIGLRLTIPFSTKQESVTGFDVGFWARSSYFEGIAVNILRNDVKDQLTGIQIGLYNSASQADAFGLQVGLWNEALHVNGLQAGLVNAVGAMHGFQVGIINRAEELYGFQVGAINIIRDAEIRFCPIVNIGF